MDSNSLSADFIELVKRDHPSNWEVFLKALENPTKVSIRRNPNKAKALNHLPLAEPVIWAKNGFWLSQRPSFTFDPLFHAGHYYVQEASSMFLEQAFNFIFPNPKGLKVLDLCAAPGGKSTHLLDLLSSDSLLVSNEVIQTRVNVLAENLCKWGTSNYIVCNNDPKDFSNLHGYFDLVLVDAPCSGEGLFRKDVAARKEWSLDNVKLCSARQQRILEHAVDLIKPGGFLIYSTCTFNKMEDEEQINYLKKEFDLIEIKIRVDENIKNELGISSHENSFYKFLPHKSEGEGFFISCLQKQDGKAFRKSRFKSKLEKINKNQIAEIQKWIPDYDSVHPILFNNEFYFTEVNLGMEMENILHSGLKIKASGIHAGIFHREDFSPAHGLAMWKDCSNAFNECELDFESAIAYLQKKDFSLQGQRKKGWNLIKYKDANLGWIKDLGNRINNYYPSDWRIRKDTTSEVANLRG